MSSRGRTWTPEEKRVLRESVEHGWDVGEVRIRLAELGSARRPSVVNTAMSAMATRISQEAAQAKSNLARAARQWDLPERVKRGPAAYYNMVASLHPWDGYRVFWMGDQWWIERRIEGELVVGMHLGRYGYTREGVGYVRRIVEIVGDRVWTVPVHTASGRGSPRARTGIGSKSLRSGKYFIAVGAGPEVV